VAASGGSARRPGHHGRTCRAATRRHNGREEASVLRLAVAEGADDLRHRSRSRVQSSSPGEVGTPGRSRTASRGTPRPPLSGPSSSCGRRGVAFHRRRRRSARRTRPFARSRSYRLRPRPRATGGGTRCDGMRGRGRREERRGAVVQQRIGKRIRHLITANWICSLVSCLLGSLSVIHRPVASAATFVVLPGPPGELGSWGRPQTPALPI